jgi:hypothetical protein
VPTFLKAQSSNKYVKTSMITNGVLFFVKPLELQSKQANLSIDFTYPCRNQESDSVTINFSLFTEKPILQVLNLEFASSTAKVVTNKFIKFFVEKDKNKWHNRYSSKISITDFKKILDISPKSNIVIVDNYKNSYLFETDKNWAAMTKTTAELILVNTNK